MSVKYINELKQRRAQLIEDSRKVLEAAESEKRSLTSEDNAKFDAIHNDVAQIDESIERAQKTLNQERSAAQFAAQAVEQEAKATDKRSKEDLLVEAARSWIATGEVRDSKAAEEFRNLQVGSNIEGGYLVTPENFVSQLIKVIDDQTVVRGLATVIPVGMAQSIGAPSLDTDPDDADWTTELATGSEDTAMRFGKRKLTPHPFAKRIKISNELLRIGMMSPEALVLQRLGYKFAITEEKGFLTGTGSNQPLGLFTASNQGISTARDISSENTTTAMTFNGLKNAFYSIKSGYSDRGQWLFHRDGVKQLSKIKDNDGQYIWQQAVREGDHDMLLGRPVIMSEYVPNTFTTGLYVGLFGDFSHYWIADAHDLMMKRLEELYAETNQTGFIGRKSADGMPVLEEAFARIKLA